MAYTCIRSIDWNYEYQAYTYFMLYKVGQL